MKPETLSSETIHRGRVFDIRVDSIREGEAEYQREIVVHRGSAVIVPVFADGRIALVRQYRHAVGEFMLELPAGLIDENESPEIGAARELEEEIGVTAAKLEPIAEFYASPGFLTEKIFIYLATELTETVQKLDDDEIVEIERYSFPEVFDLIRSGDIMDAKTIIGLTFAGPRFGFAF